MVAVQREPQGSSRRSQTRKPADGTAKISRAPAEAPLSSTELAELRARAAVLLETSIEYIPNPVFPHPEVAAQMHGELDQKDHDDPDHDPQIRQAPRGLPAYLASLYSIPLLSKGREAALFRRMNFYKSQAERLRRQIDLAAPERKLLDQIDESLRWAQLARDELIQSNLRLVVSIAKQFVDPANSFDDLVSEGNMALLRSIEKFDFARGFRFSTYATWAIRRSIFHAIAHQRREQGRARNASAENLEEVGDNREEFQPQHADPQILTQLSGVLDQLNERERTILSLRFGLSCDEPMTLREVGAALGVSKERVRQIELRALAKLRGMMGDTPPPQ